MGFGSALKKAIGLTDVEDEEITQEEIEAAKESIKSEEPEKPERPAYQPAQVQGVSRITNTTSQTKVILIEPRSADDCPKLVDSLKARRPVIINFEKVESQLSRQVFDFLSGATYALGGSVQKIASNTYFFAPPSVGIVNTESTASDEMPDYTLPKSPWIK